jgi:hypothetical protein
MLTSVHRRPPPSANCANTIRVNIGERSRTEVNETETETGGQAALHGAARLRNGAPLSVEAISRALNLAPVPAGRGGQPSSACKLVLVGLASHAGPDGTGAFPSVATLVRYTGLSERTVRTCLDRLAAGGIISPGDPDIVAARIKRADRRPQGWDLNLSLVRHDLGAAAVAVLDRQLPGLGNRARRGRAVTAGLTGCNHRTPLPPAARLWITGPAGCSRHADGVQPAPSRGAAVAPNHPRNRAQNRLPPPRAGARRCPQQAGPPAAAGGLESSSPRSARPGC